MDKTKYDPDLVNTNWCYVLDIEEECDTIIILFKRDEWFSNNRKLVPTVDDFIYYRIIIPESLHIDKEYFLTQLFNEKIELLYSNLDPNNIRKILNDNGFIDFESLKIVNKEVIEGLKY